jgi:hypothetical protein
MRKRKRKIPGPIEWSGYKDDLDVRHAHKLFFWQANLSGPAIFWRTRSIERAAELLFMPRQAFQYYVLAFADFVLSDSAIGDPDSASPFLRLLVSRYYCRRETEDFSTVTVASNLRCLEEPAEILSDVPRDIARRRRAGKHGYTVVWFAGPCGGVLGARSPLKPSEGLEG